MLPAKEDKVTICGINFPNRIGLAAGFDKNGMFPGAPSSAFYAMGVGTQIIYIDPENELVIVARWFEKDKMPDFVTMVLASIEN